MDGFWDPSKKKKVPKGKRKEIFSVLQHPEHDTYYLG
jgi:hypothetical protein